MSEIQYPHMDNNEPEYNYGGGYGYDRERLAEAFRRTLKINEGVDHGYDHAALADAFERILSTEPETAYNTEPSVYRAVDSESRRRRTPRSLEFYDVEFQDKSVVLVGMPELAPNLTSGRTTWHQEGVVEIGQGVKIHTGSRGALTYVLDPRTSQPITRGFHNLLEISNDGLVYGLGATRVRITAADPHTADKMHNIRQRDISGPLRNYPRFLHAPELMYTPLVQTVAKAAAKELETPKENLFGLEKTPVDAMGLLGQQVYSLAMSGLTRYASRNQTVMNDLMQPEALVRMPLVDTDYFSGQLLFSSYDNGTNVVRLSGASDPLAHQESGFFLVQGLDGGVIVFDAHLKHSLTSDDAGYKKYITAAEKYLEHYFELLQIGASAEALSGPTIHDMRRQLGNMSVRQARRILGNLGSSAH